MPAICFLNAYLMKKEFVLNILFLLFINILIKPVYIFGIDRTVQNQVGSQAYGVYYALLSLCFLFVTLNDFGIQAFTNGNIAKHPKLLQKYFENLFGLKVILSSIYIVVVLSAALFLGYDLAYFHLLLAIIFIQIFINFTLFFRACLSALQYYRIDSFLSILDRILLILGVGFLLWFAENRANFKIEWFIYSQLLVAIFTAVVVAIILSKNLSRFTFRLKKAFILLFLRQSYPFALTVFLMSVYSRLDLILLERMVSDGAEQAGIYASAYRLFDAATMINMLFASLLLPMFSKNIKNPVELRQLFNFAWKAISFLSISIAGVSFTFKNELMQLLYKNNTPYSGNLLGFLMLGFVGMCTMHLFSTILTAHGNMRKMNYAFLLVILCSLTTNLLLIPSLKAQGAVIATFITHSFSAVVLGILVHKELKWQFDVKIIAQIFLYGCFCFCIFAFAKHFLPFEWKIQLIVGSFVSLFFGFITYLLPTQEILSFLKQKLAK